MEVKVSVIMPAYNAKKYISEAIASVANQSEPDWELVIVDDASADDTREIIKHWAQKDRRVRPIYLEENQGSAVARNVGIQAAQGRYLAFLDADDLWHPHKLTRQLSFMEDTGAAITFTEFNEIDEEGKEIRGAEPLPDAVNYELMLKRNWMGCLTVMLDREKLSDLAFPLIRKRQDYALWLKLMRENQVPALCLNQSLASHRTREGSLSKKKLNLLLYNYRVFRMEGHGVFSSMRFVFGNVFHRLQDYRAKGFGHAEFLKKTAFLIGLITIISRSMGFLREVLIARTFGASAEADSFFLMQSMISFIWLFSGVFSNGMIPLLIEIRNRKGDEADLIRRLTQGLVILYAAVVGVLLLVAPGLVRFLGYGFSEANQALTVVLFRIAVCSVFFHACYDLNINYLKSHQRFLVGNLAGIVMNLVYLVFFLLLPPSIHTIIGLTVTMMLGTAAKYLATLPSIRSLGYRFHWVTRFWESDDVKKLMRLSIPLILGSVVYHVNGIVDKILATGLPTGSVSSLNYAYKVISTYNSLVMAIFVTLLFPTLSHFAQTEQARFRRAIDRFIRVMADILVPSVVGLVVLAEPVVTVLYRRGAFDQQALVQTTSLLRIYSIGILAMGINALYVKGFYANQETRKPMVIGAISVSVNILLDFLLIGRFGVQGLAVATVIASYLGLSLRRWVFYRDYGKSDVKSRLPALVPPLAASFVMGGFAFLIQRILGPFYLYHMNILVKLGGMLTVIGLSALVYAAVLWFFHPPEWEWLIKRRK